MSEKLIIKQTVIVEGKYDKSKLKDLIASPVMTTGGFRIFKDKEKQKLIRTIAKTRGVLILTDSDSAGFVIRNFLKGIISEGEILNAYIPEILGKEKRKSLPSKEGKLGVEGMDIEILEKAVRQSGADIVGADIEQRKSEINKADLFSLGLSGRANSKIKREEVLKILDFPLYLSSNEFLGVINSLYSFDEFVEFLKKNNIYDAESL